MMMRRVTCLLSSTCKVDIFLSGILDSDQHIDYHYAPNVDDIKTYVLHFNCIVVATMHYCFRVIRLEPFFIVHAFGIVKIN